MNISIIENIPFILMGLYSVSIGFNIIKPFKPEKAAKMNTRFFLLLAAWYWLLSAPSTSILRFVQTVNGNATNQTHFSLDLSGKAGGIYFVKSTIGNGMKVQKIVKE